MARPLRIEYPNAVYHVMNRGKGRASIFHGKAYTALFIQSLIEAHEQFGLEVLAYCLMSNHYHLLVRTPRGNLSRAMRHINGVYTQRYNKLRKTDGALFRGRYKAILVEEDSYLLPVSRYIHRNPIETKRPMVEKLVDYSLSSYPAYINNQPAPSWLNRELVLSLLNTPKKYQAYQQYVGDAISNELLQFYNNKQQAVVLGSKAFVKKIKELACIDDREVSGYKLLDTVSMEQVVQHVATYLGCDINDILYAKRGQGQKNQPRRIAMYFCQQKASATLPEIARVFNVGHYSTVSQAIRRLKAELVGDKRFVRLVKVLSQDLTL